ncbi:MAG: iron-containing alcohol dehydrogenase [Clostridiaceae bacterium]|jgi:alcohol dehydrogenase YqhD (iron-dependent ADH family)|nr:iron-containing alcohol dehydrogenase [Bacillota bacterium]NLN51582.1 iron-containing alcohol dehydrogenase [Clostridiaceae bacterium]
MLNFDFCSPTYFAFGKDTEERTGELVKRFGGSKVLIHYGEGSVERSGLLNRVKKSLQESEIEFVELGGVQPNPRASLVYEGIELCREEQVDFILGVGGGSAVDSAKAIAVGVPYDGDFWDLYEQRPEIEEVIPVGTIITLAATGSEGSNSSVITQEKGWKKYGFRSELIRPVFSIMNPELTYTLPPYQTACGIVDMLSHILERYFSNTKEVDLTDRMSEAVMKSIIDNAFIVMNDPENYGARANLMWAGNIAHNDTLGVGREQDWSSHQIEHELSALYDVAHGAGLAVVLPAFMKFTMPKHVMRYAQLANRVWNMDINFEDPKQTASKGIAAFEMFFKMIGMPTTFEELGAKEEDIPQLTSKVRIKGDGEILGFFEPLTRDDIRSIYQLCVG